MSQLGSIVFHTGTWIGDGCLFLTKTLEYLGSPGCDLGMYLPEEDRSWARFQLGRESSLKTQSIDGDLSLQAVVGHCRRYSSPGFVQFGFCPNRVSRIVWRGIHESIPSQILGQFLPTETSIIVGRHDLFECAESEQGRFYGRASFSVQFWGYGTPNDWGLCRELILQLPQIESVRLDLEQCLQVEVASCIFWDA